jgi:hypothetical protein
MSEISSQPQPKIESNDIALLRLQLRDLEESNRYYKHLFETQQKILEEKKSECVQLRLSLEQQKFASARVTTGKRESRLHKTAFGR